MVVSCRCSCFLSLFYTTKKWVLHLSWSVCYPLGPHKLLIPQEFHLSIWSLNVVSSTQALSQSCFEKVKGFGFTRVFDSIYTHLYPLLTLYHKKFYGHLGTTSFVLFVVDDVLLMFHLHSCSTTYITRLPLYFSCHPLSLHLITREIINLT